MTRPTLPNETLNEIFSHLPSSKGTLYNVSLASSTFSELAKPFLYQHVTITSKNQRERLKNVKEEDAKLVRKLTIRGVQTDPNALHDDGSECSVGTNCIVDLFTENLLDISVIEVLHVAHLYENAEEQRDDIPCSIFAAVNLTELSILDHQGGGAFWSRLLDRAEVMPKLVRLGIEAVTEYSHQWIRPNNRNIPSGSRSSLQAIGGYEWVRRLTYFDDDQRWSRLEAIVARPGIGFSWDIQGKLEVLQLSSSTISGASNLALLLLAVKESWNVGILKDNSDELPSEEVFQKMLEACREVINKRTVFLSLPYLLSDLSDEILDILSDIENEDVEVHYLDEEEEDSISIIPNSFVDFVKRQKKKKEDEKENTNADE